MRKEVDAAVMALLRAPFGCEFIRGASGTQGRWRIHDANDDAIASVSPLEEGYARLIVESLNEHFSRTGRSRPVVEPTWEDRVDRWSEAIKAAFPTRSGSHEQYGQAMEMIHNRHSKGELVALINYLLVEIKKGKER